MGSNWYKRVSGFHCWRAFSKTWVWQICQSPWLKKSECCQLQDWKMREITLSPALGGWFGVWVVSNHFCEAGMAVTWGHASISKQVDGQRVLGFYCFFSHRQNLETALMFGRLVPCLFSVKKIRKDEGVEGWEEGKQERKKSQKRGKKSVFKWERNNVNRMYGICGVLLYVLALFGFVKAFQLLAVTKQILQGELLHRSGTSRELKPGPRGI